MEHNGDLYSCDHFVEPRYKLENVEQDKSPIVILTATILIELGLLLSNQFAQAP